MYLCGCVLVACLSALACECMCLCVLVSTYNSTSCAVTYCGDMRVCANVCAEMCGVGGVCVFGGGVLCVCGYVDACV